MQPFFVDEDDNIFIGPEAAEKLQSRNDTQFLQAQQGVIEVDLNRWKEAQHYERRTWMEAGGLGAQEDYNSEHELHFGNYAAIAGRHFDNALEIGCGPFTNMAHVLNHIKSKQVVLLDPLINDYLTHPNCAYKNKRLGAVEVETIAEPIENYFPERRFDLVVMINVLEHCFSLPKLFERISSLVAAGGILVFHDKLIPASDIDDFVHNIFDAGHPIRVADQVIMEFLSHNYDELYRKHVEVPLEDYMGYTFDSIYFIGRKKV